MFTNVYLIPDINECQNDITNPCDLKSGCMNLNGSYSCNCSVGFELLADGTTCKGQ